MQRGLAGVAIVSMVLAATILIGYVVSEPSTVTVTTYDSLTDLAPIVEAESASEYVEYYPAGNVTGWSGNVALPLTDSATIYVYTPASSGYTKTEYSDMGGANGVWITPGQTIHGGAFATNRSGVTALYNGTTSPASYVWMGGASGNAFELLGWAYNHEYYSMAFNGSVASGVYWIDLAALSATFTQDMAVSVPDLGLYADCSISVSVLDVPVVGQPYQNKNHYYTYNVVGSPVSVSGDYLYYQQATGAWYSAIYDESFGFKTSGAALGSNLRYIATDNANHAWTLYKPTINPTQYVLPNTPVTINGMADWSNGSTNGVVKILMSPSLDIYPATAPIIPLEPLGGLGNVPFEMVVLTLDALNNRVYWQGVTNYVGPTQYTLLDYEYTLPGGGATVEDLSGLVFNGNGLAYILSTTIATDPNGILWGNPSMDLVHYFPAVMSNGARVQFNGFVVTGQSITIDGHTYTVTDGSITVDGKAHKLAGLAVDYRIDGHTYLVFTQESKAVYDLGASGSKEIAASGTWYYTAELQTINTSIKESNSLVFGGWNMDKSTACLVFVGFLVVGAVGGSYLIPNGLRPLDWIVLVAAGAIALCMM